MWNNAAGAVLGDGKFQVGASYTMWNVSAESANALGPYNIAAVAGYGRVAKFMTVSAGDRYFGGNPYDIVDDATGVISGTFTPVNLQAGIGLGFRILPMFSLGANVSYVHSVLSKDGKAGAVSADFGALLDLKFMRVGVTASNIGSGLDYGTGPNELPANLKIGVGTEQRFGNDDKHTLSVNLEGGMLFSQTSFFAGVGAQYAWNDMLRVSAGYHYGDQATQFYGSYASVGIGVKVIGILFNAAYLIGTDKDSPLTNTFSLGLGFAF